MISKTTYFKMFYVISLPTQNNYVLQSHLCIVNKNNELRKPTLRSIQEK